MLKPLLPFLAVAAYLLLCHFLPGTPHSYLLLPLTAVCAGQFFRWRRSAPRSPAPAPLTPTPSPVGSCDGWNTGAGEGGIEDATCALLWTFLSLAVSCSP